MKNDGAAYAISVVMFGYQSFSGSRCLVCSTTKHSIELTLANVLKNILYNLLEERSNSFIYLHQNRSLHDFSTDFLKTILCTERYIC